MRVFDENLQPLDSYDMAAGDLTSYAPLGPDAFIYRPYPAWLIEANRQAKEDSEIVPDLSEAVADLSEVVSSNAIDSADMADAIAELSDLVSQLMEGA